MSDGILKREGAEDYIPATEAEQAEMLCKVGESSLDGLFDCIADTFILGDSGLGKKMSPGEVMAGMEAMAAKNKLFRHSFLGDSLPIWNVEPICSEIASMRGLYTAYTPYQPERSQGTLISHWIYQCAVSALTGFEAVNCSLYDRATAIFEAAACAVRITRGDTAVLSSSLLPGDIETVKTLARFTGLKIAVADDIAAALDVFPNAACVVYPQISNVGLLNDVDAIADICSEKKVKFVAVVDPMLLGDGGLKPPSEFGKKGADIVVGEGQHLCSPPNFGGPGLGLFAVRFNESNKTDIRQSPGRFVGMAKDISGRPAFAMVMSAREQHIRREKATSNICSNQAFMATLAGAALLSMGDSGMRKALETARAIAEEAFEKITSLEGFDYPFGEAPFFNEFCVETPIPAGSLIEAASNAGIALGIDAGGRAGMGKNILKISFSNANTRADVDALVGFLSGYATGLRAGRKAPEIPRSALRISPPKIPSHSFVALKKYYLELSSLNASPDSACYPLGSCTMKYNPLLLDRAAALPGFANSHPQAPERDTQGNLELLWRFAEAVKSLTNLDDVALQPVAGAQGELCGLKMVQAYHRDNSDGARDVILIPSSAHGTNFASAAMAGFKTENIIRIPAAENGMIDLSELLRLVEKYGDRISAVMITNPNTSGIFESGFADIADAVHKAGGLVYMDGANFNAVAGRLDLKAMGVDAVHNNIHKTWAVAHGGGGPGDGFVAVAKKLSDYIPSYRVVRRGEKYFLEKPKKSVGSFHRNFGNFANKVRALAYIWRLGNAGVRRMSASAVLASRYLFEKLGKDWEILPKETRSVPRMHEFIITPPDDVFEALEKAGVSRRDAVARIGKMFLDFGFHAPTVAFPEVFGLMVEPTESYDKAELDRFAEAASAILRIIRENPYAAAKAPRFTPIDRIDDVEANRKPVLSSALDVLPEIPKDRVLFDKLGKMDIKYLIKLIASDS